MMVRSLGGVGFVIILLLAICLDIFARHGLQRKFPGGQNGRPEHRRSIRFRSSDTNLREWKLIGRRAAGMHTAERRCSPPSPTCFVQTSSGWRCWPEVVPKTARCENVCHSSDWSQQKGVATRFADCLYRDNELTVSAVDMALDISWRISSRTVAAMANVTDWGARG